MSRYAGLLTRRSGRGRSRCVSRPCRSRRTAPTAVSVGIADGRYCNHANEEVSIHSLLPRLVPWNDRSALVGAQTPARPRRADHSTAANFGQPDRVDSGVLQDRCERQTHAPSARVCRLIALSRATVRRVSRTFARSRSLRPADHERDAADGPTSRRLTWSATCPRCRSPCG